MYRLIIAVFILLILGCNTRDKYQFTYSEGEAKGWSSARLDSLAAYLEESGSSGMILMVDGDVIFEWGEIDRKHTIHSIRKAMLNSLYGIKIAEGVIDTTETIGNLGIDDIYPLTEQEKTARIADLLRSRSGIYHPAAAVSEGMLKGMPGRDQYKPGEHYYYNNWDFNVLGYILELKTGESIYSLFRKNIADPLGMHDYQGQYTSIKVDEEIDIPDTDGFYQYEESKSKYPAYHFRLSARDMALYGQLYLNKGKWGNEQIIPESWIDTSTTPYSLYNTYMSIGYGMLWYVLAPREDRPTKSFYHTGTGVHMLGVYPGSKLVLVHRVDTENDYSFGEQEFYGMIGKVFAAQN